MVRLACAVVFLALLMTLPLFLLLALHPTIGRKLLVRWLELAVGALWRQVIYSLFLGVISARWTPDSGYTGTWSNWLLFNEPDAGL